jgi:predicted NACHT family NTPase
MTDTLPLSIQPVISYPKEAEVGKTYLMEIDLQMPGSGFEWQYEEEEYLIYCMVNAGNLFTVTSVGEPAIVLHRFGETYGSTKILLEAALEEKSGTLSVLFVNQWGTTIRTITLAVIIQAKKPIQNSAIVAFIDSLDKRQKRELSQNIPAVSPIVSLFKQVNHFLQQPIDIATIRDFSIDTINQLTGFESKYLEKQKFDCYKDHVIGIMELRRFYNYPVLQLQEIFVPLRLTVNAKESGYDRYASEEDYKTTQIWNLLRNSQNGPQSNQIVIHAWGGFGKTTLLKHLSFVYSVRAYGKYNAPKFIPFLIYLAGCYEILSQDNPPNLPEFLTNDHVNELLKDQKLVAPSNWVLNLLREGQALVMFDGFDEVPISERAKVSEWLSTAMQKYRKSVFILTSRPTAYRENYTAQKPSLSFWIEKFDQEQCQKFVEQWYLCLEILDRGGRSGRDAEHAAKTRAKSLLDQIKQRPELDAISGNGLLLNMVVRYYDALGAELPQHKIDLYQGICELQLDRRPSLKGIKLLLNSTSQRQEVLQFVALEMMKRVTNDREESFKQIQHDDLLSKLKVGLNKFNIKSNFSLDKFNNSLDKFNNEVNVKQFLAQMVDISEMLVRRDENIYQFSHLSFQEFFAASELVRLKDDGEVLLFEKLSLKAWKDTILFYADLVNPTRLIQEAIKQGETDMAYQIYRKTNSRLNLSYTEEKALEGLKETVKTLRYKQLEEYLKSEQWQEADRETYHLIITAVGKENGKLLSRQDLHYFPCDDLLAINGLWVKHSNGLYGFSIQKDIYVECGGKLDFSYPSSNTWDKFCDRVAWKDKGNYVFYSNIFMSNYMSTTGHLPLISDYEGGEGRVELFLFSRIATCEM